MGFRKFRLSIFLMAAGGSVLILGSFLPWARLARDDYTGVDYGFGLVSVTGGVVAIVTAARLATEHRRLGLPPKRWLGTVVVLAAMSIVAAGYVARATEQTPLPAFLAPTVSVGVFAVALGGAVSIVGAAFAAKATKESPRDR